MSDLLRVGSFRVDRSRALEKLMNFQLPDPTFFPLPLVRCAVASGATRLLLRFSGREVVMEFVGKPFSADELRDPYSCLLEERGSELRRNRELATALLTALRLSPNSITVDSGEGPARVRLTVLSLREESVASLPGEENVTRVLVRLPFMSLAVDFPMMQ